MPARGWRRSRATCRKPTLPGAGPSPTLALPTSACKVQRSLSSTRHRAASTISTRSTVTRPTITERSLRAADATTIVVLGTLLAAIADVSAHRRDEYLQAARLAIEPTGIRLELSLTPGIAVADAVLRDIDVDGDHALSAAEQRT